jgi:hypothetical protein
MSGSRRHRGMGARLPSIFLAAVVIVGVGIAAFLEQAAGPVFQPYFGPIDPAVAVALVLGSGAVALVVLRSHGWFAVHRGGRSGLLPVTAAAAALSVPVIVVDLRGGFGPDINVGWPSSLLFYPLIGLVAESVFHVIPLGALSGLLRGLGREKTIPSPPIAGMGAVCLIEPALQMVWGSDTSPAWANAYVGIHVLVINALGIYFFRRYDFVSMYWFRLTYYLLWHITWGSLRLSIIFGA